MITDFNPGIPLAHYRQHDGAVSLLEGGQRRLSPMWLRRLATALRAPVGAFLEYGPDQGRADVLDLWAAISQPSRPIALEIMRGFCRR